MIDPADIGGDKRRFQRVAFDGEAWLACGATEIPCRLIDISLRGALVGVKDSLDVDSECSLHISLATDAEIAMRVRVSRVLPEVGQMALECLSIDIDSIQQLRRLVELNLGDENILHRNLAALYSD